MIQLVHGDFIDNYKKKINKKIKRILKINYLFPKFKNSIP